MIKWLHDKQFSMNSFVFDKAVLNCDLDMLKLLKQLDCPWKETALLAAMKVGDLARFEWLLANQCPVSAMVSGNDDWVNDTTMYHAIRSKSLELVQWAVQLEDYKLHSRVLKQFVWLGSSANNSVMPYLIGHGLFDDDQSEWATWHSRTRDKGLLLFAVKWGSIPTVVWMWNHKNFMSNYASLSSSWLKSDPS